MAGQKATSPNPQLPARFRERTPDFHGLEADGPWSYYENPFVGTRQLNGLLTVHAMLGNSDLKDAQNAIHTLKEPVEGAPRWFVARDLGQTFGRSGALDPPRGDPDVFDKTGFITGVENGYVRFDYRGRHKALFEKNHAGRRPVGVPAAVGAQRRAAARCLSRRRLSACDGRPFHLQAPAEDCRGRSAEGLTD